jgi:hypothetical protein
LLSNYEDVDAFSPNKEAKYPFWVVSSTKLPFTSSAPDTVYSDTPESAAMNQVLVTYLGTNYQHKFLVFKLLIAFLA